MHYWNPAAQTRGDPSDNAGLRLMGNHELDRMARQLRRQGHDGAHIVIGPQRSNEVRLNRDGHSQLRPGTIDIRLGADNHFVGSVG